MKAPCFNQSVLFIYDSQSCTLTNGIAFISTVIVRGQLVLDLNRICDPSGDRMHVLNICVYIARSQ